MCGQFGRTQFQLGTAVVKPNDCGLYQGYLSWCVKAKERFSGRMVTLTSFSDLRQAREFCSHLNEN